MAGKTSIGVERDLHARIRAAVRVVRRKTGQPYTVAQFVREAIGAQLAVVARDYNDGRVIGPDDEPLPAGRPIGVEETRPRPPRVSSQ